MRNKDYNKQQRIKKAMVSLVLKEGIHGTSISRIAKKAGVSPATIYVYYASKDDMLSEVFNECLIASYKYLLDRLRPDMSGDELIDSLARGIFRFVEENEEIFSFINQCSSCPTLQEKVYRSSRDPDIFDLLHSYQQKGIIRSCSDICLAAMLIAPIEHLAIYRNRLEDPEAQLDELIGVLKKTILI